MSVLTRAEAQQRARVLDVERYVVDLDLTVGDEVFRSVTRVEFAVREEGAEVFAEVRPVVVRRVVLDGVEWDPGVSVAEGRLPLRGLAAGAHELLVEADMRYSRVGEGMHRFTDPVDGLSYVYTQCCMADAPLVFACFDQPDLKAVFEVSVTAPEGWTVLGNGVARQRGAGRWVCAPTPRISTYLMAVVAGPFHSVRAEHAGLPFGLHVRRSLGAFLDADAGELLEVTRRCFDRYHEIFDEPYAFDSYDQAFVPEFNLGAMENPGLVTLRDEFVFRSAVTETERQQRGMVLAHEMAHMWFGDLVTLRWWDDIWLNESFAEYMGYQVLAEATGFSDAWTDFAVSRKGWGYEADQRPSTHPVAPAAEAVPDTAAGRLNFDGISYAKGASALRQLVAWLGEKSFLAGINEHFARHRFGNATLADFLDSLARVSGRDARGWADRWLRTTGVDTVTPRVAESAGGWSVEVRNAGSRPHRLAVGLYDVVEDGAGRRLVLRGRPEGEVAADGGRLSLSGGGRRPDLVLVNDLDLSYVKVRLDEVSWGMVREALSGLPDALSRAVVWNAARDMVRDGELSPEGFVGAVRAHLPRERDNAVVQAVLAFVRSQVADRFVGAGRRGAVLAAMRTVCGELLQVTAGGGVGASGLRLTAVRHFIDSAVVPDVLWEWWSAGSVPGGPVLDAELRWRLLLRLCVLGAAGEGEVAAELAADPGAAGAEGAARCRAALPDAAAKERAWAAMFEAVPEAEALSAHVWTATAQGFWQPEQRAVLAGFVERYFADVVVLARRRGAAIAEAAGRSGFPRSVVDAGVLRRGEECLAGGGEVVPVLRRQLADQVDDLRRALRVRENGARENGARG